MDESEFQPILEAARAGAGWAWSRLHANLSGPVLGYLRSRGAREPEDLLGEVFVQVARNLNAFSGPYPSFRSWIFTVAHHRIIDERRYLQRRPVLPAEISEAALGVGDVESEAMASLSTDGVISLLSTLTSNQRDVLLLRIVAGLAVEDIAWILGKRPGAIKALQRRGLETLRRRIRRVPFSESPPVAGVKWAAQ